QVLKEQGKRVRQVRRSAKGIATGIEACPGDITELTFAERAGAGASVIYDCMNPTYDKWDEQLLPIARGSLHAAETSGAKLVALDCLYMYGRPLGGVMHEDSTRAPCSHKGELRVELEQLRMSGGVRVAIARASDFFGAGLQQSAFSDRFFERAFAGKAVECLGDADMPHSYTYVEDVVTALATLGREGEGIWHVPTSWHGTTRELYDLVGVAIGVGPLKVMRVPKLLVRGLGLFNGIMREMVEMMYQWEVPYVLDDSKFRKAFGIEATPIERAVSEVASWARQQHRQAA
ncbi:MAG TPA: NAD-dependent epimerase/dehydratase family protein, partial [Polyangiales bacterium]|nr:NAD-dependent epimerase/dehydratase family protein [Polyangiales bacterium]